MIGSGWPRDKVAAMCQLAHKTEALTQSSLDPTLKLWTNDLRFASCYTTAGTAQSTEDEAEVLVLTNDEVEARLASGVSLTKPTLLRETSNDIDNQTIEAYIGRLAAATDGQGVDVQQPGKLKAKRLTAKQFADQLRQGIAVNALNLRNFSRPSSLAW